MERWPWLTMGDALSFGLIALMVTLAAILITLAGAPTGAVFLTWSTVSVFNGIYVRVVLDSRKAYLKQAGSKER